MTISWEALSAICAALTIIFGGLSWWIKQSIEREAERRQASADRIEQAQKDFKEDLTKLGDSFERRVDRLETQAKDFRPGQAIDQAIEHSRNNLRTMFEAVKKDADKNSLAIESLRDRVTIQETKHAAVEGAVADLKHELRDTRSEINHRFDAAADVAKSQFDQLCASIREVTKREPL